RFLYEQSMQKLGWNDPSKPVLRLHPDPRFLAAALLVAHDLGDLTTVKRLREVVERDFDPRWFGDEKNRFGWWFGLDEEYPRGQLSALVMVCEAAGTGAWSRPFRQPNLEKFDQPTVEGIDYPALGVSRAWNDVEEGMLDISTYAATPSRRGQATAFRVTKLAAPASVTLWCDHQPFPRWRRIGEDAIEIETEVGEHRFRVATRESREAGGRGSRGGRRSPTTETGTAEARRYVPAPVSACSCCRTPGASPT
ncbi:MAG: hypothetical protein ACREQQ_00480, partial [Candidatus Binatia bacterium]